MERINAEKEVELVGAEVILWRRHLHCFPELSFQEEKTAQFVYEKLQNFGGLEISRPTSTSVVARLIGVRPGSVLALRADMDALPIAEQNDVAYASQRPGVMHACGHDGHTAMLLGAAKVLSKFKNDIAGEVRFIFQHAEELPPGGAAELVEAGVLQGVDAIIGFHLSTDLPVGKIGLADGVALANTDTFDIEIMGKGGHGSRPEETIDPIIIGAQVVTNLQQVVSRNVSALQPAVVSVTFFQGGNSYNVIPSAVKLGGTVRSFDLKVRQEIPRLMENVVSGVTQAHGATYQFSFKKGYSAVTNNSNLAEKIKNIGGNLFGPDQVANFPKRMGGEDFSAYLERVPGCFVFIGAANAEKGLTHSTHNPCFDIDEAALVNGLKLYVNLALEMTGPKFV